MNRAMIFWACAALLLMAAETFVPGASLMWLGFAAAGTFVLVWFLPLSPLWQALAFVLLGFVAVAVFIRYFRQRAESALPLLNRRGAQLVGQVFVLHEAIVNGRGRIKSGDALWTVTGPDLPVGASVRVIAADSMELKVDPAG